MSNWTQAEPDLETLRLIIFLTVEFYELTGRWPTAMDLRAALRKPS